MYDPTNTTQNRATANDAGTFSPHPGEAHQSAARGEQGKQGPDYLGLLHEALTEPGKVSACYSMFHRFSLSNALWVADQLASRGEPLAPIASFKRWQELGRQVKRGSKALMLCMPVTVKGKADAKAEGEGEDAQGRRVIFVARRNWFAFHHTEALPGTEPQPIEDQAPAAWNPGQALQTLGIEQVPFRMTDGNCQGYAEPQARRVAINPLAAQPIKTLCHELAHCLLHTEQARIIDGTELDRSLAEVEAESVAYLCCAVLGCGDLEASRGYIRGWLGSADAEAFESKHARRVIATSDKILKAGRQAETETEAAP
jgi:antirestriction protein ArdC